MSLSLETSSETVADNNEIKLISIVHAFHAALTDADKESLESLTDNGLSYGHSNGRVEDKTIFIENILNGNSVFEEIEISGQSIKLSGDAAIIRHHFYAKTNDNNVPGVIKLNVLQVWQKQNDAWKLLARQAVKL